MTYLYTSLNSPINFREKYIDNIMALGPGKYLISHHKSLERPLESLETPDMFGTLLKKR